MQRREYLATVGGLGGLGSVGVSGCLRLTGAGTDSPTGTPTDGTAATPTTTASPAPGTVSDTFRRQLEQVREAAAPYEGEDGMMAAIEGEFYPLNTGEGNWRLLRDPVPLADLTIGEPTAFAYARATASDPLALVGVGYSVRFEDHQSGSDHVPPDLFDDEGADLERSEADNWYTFHNHPIEPIRAAFASGDDDRDGLTELDYATIFDPTNWRSFIDAETWTAQGGLEPGDAFDVDGDDEPEVLDFVLQRKTAWDLSVFPFGESATEPFVPPEDP